MTGHAQAGILKSGKVALRQVADQMFAKAGRGEYGDAFIPILGVDKHAAGEGANGSFNRADMNVGDQQRDASIVQQGADIAEEHNIRTAEQLFH